MAEAANDVVETINGDCHDFNSLLSSSDRDFLVKIDSLKGKKLGLYFSASWCGPCRRFTPVLIQVYYELSQKGDFEVVFVSANKNEESFNSYFSKMPWTEVPFSDLETHKHLDESFKVTGIPHLVLLDENGKVLTDEGVEIIRKYGEEGYPFTSEKIRELKDMEEKARKDQSIKTLLVSPSRDFVVTSDGNKVPVSELERKTVGLCFSISSFKPYADFTPKLTEVYKKLKVKGENFEVVMISLNYDEESFKQSFASPWLALPFKDKSCKKLATYFELSILQTVVIIGSDRKTLHPKAADAIEEHGVEAYPFTPEKFAELEEIEKSKEAAQTLESILVSGNLDYVIGKDGDKV
ncbi:putative nucleoredoxin 1 [Hibiscus syriacus]|uniref:protein-disulfide reductase n=1 Tax=Hibiscus syriacus TaxID=106335 RepID=A0A6A3C0P7_HIBSY|nr:putative nucleoredoxin 1 [Hibiscus syriacus]